MIYTQLSDWTLTSKPTDPKEKAVISGKQHFHYRELSEEHFLNALKRGHGFCPLSRDQAQADTSHTNIIVYDFDHSTIPLPAFVEGLKIKPSYTYYSFSNGKDGQYRYRLIYQLSECITGSEYDAAHQYIAQANGWKPATKGDPTNKYDPLARNQYYFSGSDVTYYPNNIINEYTHTQPKGSRGAARQTKPKGSTTTANGTHPPRQRQATNTTDTTYFPTEFVSNIIRLTPHAYTQLYADSSVYYATHTPLPEVDDDTPIIQYPKDYIETPRRLFWDAVNRTHYAKKWADGEARHRKLYMAGIIIRRLNPQLSPDELLFAVCQEFATYYDNSDKKYTTADIIHIVERVLDADTGRELSRWKRKNYIVNGSYCEKYGVSKRSVVGEQNGIRQAAERADRYEQIAQWYDPSKTDAANLLTLHKAGIKCSDRTLKRFKVEYRHTEPTQAPKETPAEPAPKPKATPKPKHPTPTKDAPQQPMMPNYAFDRVTDTETIESIKKMLRRGLNNSSTIN